MRLNKIRLKQNIMSNVYIEINFKNNYQYQNSSFNKVLYLYISSYIEGKLNDK